jgi:hypothetical protein
VICVNFYGGPGIGKSTLAAITFAHLKKAGIRAELVGEFAKDLVYDKAYNVMADQHYLFAQQAHRLWRLAQSEVEVAVCDSPLLLTMAYNKDPNTGCFNPFVVDTYKRYTNIDYVLKRNPEFWEKDKRSGDVSCCQVIDEIIDSILLDVWHDFPEKVDTTKPGVVDELLDRILLQCQDAIKEETKLRNINGVTANRPALYVDEPWKGGSKKR